MGIREVVRFVGAIAALAAIAVAPNAVAAVSDTAGKTTLEQRVVPTGSRRLPLPPARGRRAVHGAAGPGDGGGGTGRQTHLARLLRPALRLPARRRGVAGPARGDRPALDPAEPPLRRRLAALGGARAADRRGDDPPGQPVRRRQPGRRRQRRPPGDGPDDRHRRLGRQPAAERDALGADPARGRQPQPQQRRRQGEILAPALPQPLRPRRRRGRPLHRRPGLRRLPRGPLPRVLRPQLARRPALGLAEIPGADGPRPAGVHRQRRQSPLLRRLRQPRRAGAGERRRQRRLRAGRDRLPEADRPGLQPGKRQRAAGTRCSTRCGCSPRS